MKKPKVCMILAAVMLTVLLGGCGDPLYNLTETEENIIVDYSAHIVSKFNSYQKDGLTWVDYAAEKEKEAAMAAAALEAELAVGESDTEEEESGADGMGGSAEGPNTLSRQTATLNELFGIQGIAIDYTGAYLANSYVQDTYYAMYPDAGKQYMVLQIDVSNTVGVDVEVDNLVLASTFRASANGEQEISAEITILLEDFGQLQEVLAADAVREAVLLFQVPESWTQIDGLELYVTMGGERYQIIL